MGWSAMVKGLLLSVTVFCGERLSGIDFEFRPEGRVSDCKIASEVMRRYAGKILGQHLDKSVFVLCLDPSLSEEEWRIQSVSGNRVKISGGSARGLLYGVYHYLEDVCGVSFLTPTVEQVPRLTSLPTAGLALHGKPAFEIRSLISLQDSQGGAFPSKRRINELNWSTISRANGGDCSVSPAPCHTFDYFIAPWDRHEEYFSLMENGERKKGQTQGQLCLSNPAVRQEVIRKLREYIEHDRKRAALQGAVLPRIYEISQNDNQNYCRCAGCKALAKRFGGRQSGVLVDFLNEIASAIEAPYPEIVISSFAYQYTELEPLNIGLHRNVVMRLCDTRGNLAAAMEDSSNRFFQDRLAGWSRLGRVSIWDYDNSFGMPLNLPVAAEYHYAANCRYLRRKGVSRIFLENSAWNFPDAYDYRYYVFSRLMENPDLDPKQVSDDFIRPYYGPVAGLFREYRRLLRQSELKMRSFIPMYPEGAGHFPHLDLDTLVRIHEIFARGRKILQGDAVMLKRWNAAAIGVDYATLWRCLHLRDEHRRRGGSADCFPLDLPAIFSRVKKSHVAWVEDYYRLQPTSGKWGKLRSDRLATLEKIYARLERMTRIPEPVFQEPFRKLAPSRLYLFLPDQAAIVGNGVRYVDDPEAMSGRAVEIYGGDKAPTGGARLPLYLELFDYGAWQGRGLKPMGGDAFQDGHYVWVKVKDPVTNLTSSTTAIISSWYLRVPLGDAYKPDGNRSFDMWLRLKAKGKDYQGTGTNQLRLDALMLVEKL